MGKLSGKLIPLVALFATSLIVLNRLNSQLELPPKDSKLSAAQAFRQISVYLGDGKCRWEEPAVAPPEDIDFLKTLIVGYPSGDKRLAFLQMEGLTGLRAKDEWDFDRQNEVKTNEPFIKSNYPHHEGVWGWEDEADQVVLVVRNIRSAMIQYHNILWDLGYANNYEDSRHRANNLYNSIPPNAEFVKWRDDHVVEEIHWYGWFIDFWMEGGLLRDPHSHNITTKEHWDLLTSVSNRFPTGDLSYEAVVGDEEVEMTYDPHCLHDFAEGCKPIAVISAERLINPDTGPSETHKIAKALQGKKGIGDFIIDRDAWDCVWEELMVNKKGLKTFLDREGDSEKDINFSEEMLLLMLEEINRLMTKYSDLVWIISPKVPVLVSILTENRGQLLLELEEVRSGKRILKYNDFLGAKTRARREHELSETHTYW